MQKSEPVVEYKQNRFDAGNYSKDRLLNLPTAEIKIECTTNRHIVGSYLVDAGVSYLTVYERDIPSIMAEVEPFPEKVAQAKELFAEESRNVANGTVKEDQRVYPNWCATYRYLSGGKDPMPLLSCTVIKTMGAPMSDDDRRAAATTQAIAEAVLKSNNSKK